MNIIQGSGRILISLVLSISIMTVILTGCMDSVSGEQNPMTAVQEKPDEHTPVVKLVTITATISLSPVATQTALKPVSSTGVITIDPVTDKNTGDIFTLSGITGLPAGTEIIWQVMPDTGFPPTGIDGNSTMSVGGNYPVTQGEGTSHLIAIPVDLGRLVPGNYTVIAGKAKEHPPDKMVFEIGDDFGYTSFRIK